MNKAALVAVGVVVGVAWYVRSKRITGADIGAALNQGGGFVEKQIENAAGALDSAFGFKRVSNMSKVHQPLVDHPNVRAFFRVIREGESSQNDAVAYRMVCGRVGAQIKTFADHPRPNLPKPCGRGASGAYQITEETWDWVKGKMGLKDFSPRSQDIAALGLIAYRGALNDVMRGDVAAAVKKLQLEWTSLPGAKENNAAAGGIEKSKRLFLAWGGSPSVYA